MITFQNKTAGPVKINIDNKAIVINEYSEYNYESGAESLTFTVEDGDPKKTKLLGYLLLTIGGLIGFLMEITDSEFLDFRKALYLPVRIKITNISQNIFVIINEPRENDINFCSITSDADLDVKTIIDENTVYSQYKSYQKECFAVFFIPILLAAALCAFIFASKNIIACIVGAIIVAIVLYIWCSYHKKNKKTILEIIRQKEQSAANC